jgi:hypothetical protein
MMPPGNSFTFLVEVDKLERIHRVVAHNDGEIVEETPLGDDIKVSVRKVGRGEPA